MTQVAERHETLTAAFDAFRRDPAFGPDWLGREREAKFERFLQRGFPTTREEEWRFTSLAPVAAAELTRAPTATPTAGDLAPFLFDGVATIVVVNGRMAPALSRVSTLPAGVTVETLVDVEPAAAAGRRRSVMPQPLEDLNGAFFEGVVTVRVAPRALVAEPIHVLAITAPGSGTSLVAPRFAIEVGEGADVTVVESYATVGAGSALTTAVTDITVGARAIVRHTKVQRESSAVFHLASTFVIVGPSATFSSQAVTFGGRIARNDIVSVLDGEGAECTLNGLYLADGETTVDTHTTIDHAKPHCPSHELYKGILAGRSKAVFNGKIIVRPDAQKTDAKQTNKALLLSDQATINTKPQLEIFADDVKCTHGAAIGQLDEDAMFYLRARGIGEVDARSLLIHAFAAEVLDGIAIESVRDRVQRLMEEKLKIAHEDRD
jgi:Fe-S cluster assembly protein SufD